MGKEGRMENKVIISTETGTVPSKFLSFAFAITLVLTSTTVFALPPGYQIETVAQYPSGNLGVAADLLVDPDGIIYVVHRGNINTGLDSSIARISGEVIQTHWVDNIQSPSSIIWTGGTDFENDIYTVDTGTRNIIALDVNGNTSPFAYISQGPSSIDIDRNGALNGDMLCSARGTDRILRINADGNITTFSYWPGVIRGGILELAISPTSRYDGNVFAAYDETDTNEHDGLYQIDASGHASIFVPSIINARGVEFDTSGLIFNNDLFVIGRMQNVEGMHLWRIDELGNAEDFMRVGWGVNDHMAFGPDGAMYLTHYTTEKTEILRISLASSLVHFDIKPDSCDNPFNVTAKGVLPVAILGTESFDVTQIDIASLRLQTVAPIRSSYEDIATPVAEPNECDCTTVMGGDGFLDLTLKFNRQELVSVIGDVEHGDVLMLNLEGVILDGTQIEGQDCIVIRGKHLGLGKADTNDDGVVNFLDLLTISEKWLHKEIYTKK